MVRRTDGADRPLGYYFSGSDQRVEAAFEGAMKMWEDLAQVGALVLPPVLLCMPLLIWLLRQDDRRRLVRWGVGGAVVGTGAGMGFLLWLTHGSGGVGLERMMMGLVGLVAVLYGLPAGSYFGVALAKMVSPDPDRRKGARRGALIGLAIGCGLTALLLPIPATREVAFAGCIFGVPLLTLLGAVFGPPVRGAADTPDCPPPGGHRPGASRMRVQLVGSSGRCEAVVLLQDLVTVTSSWRHGKRVAHTDERGRDQRGPEDVRGSP
jgi:hypothetical protein